MKFRWHRGSLDDSMKTVVNVDSLSDLKAVINTNYPEYKGDIKFEYCMYDKRVKWDTYYVSIKPYKDQGYMIIGMSDCKLQSND